MIKKITPMEHTETKWCDHCKKRCDGVRNAYLLESSNEKMGAMVLCNCCMDLALSETTILPEDF